MQGVYRSRGTSEIIFPTIIRADNHFSSPLANYYMYYSPHNAPGGINLAYSNSIEGPWTEYSGNPIISKTWPGIYNVSHVSGAHAIWVDDEEELYLYYHGENNTTRLARSADGISFSHDSIQLTAWDVYGNDGEASYARVFEYSIPSKNNKYIMLFMGLDGTTPICCDRNIFLAWSNDAKNWTVDPSPLITPNAEEGANLSSAFYYPRNGKHYVLYHASSGNIHATEVGENFDKEIHLGALFDNPVRVEQPYIVRENGNEYMFFGYGPRLDTDIAYAVAATPGGFEDVLVDNLDAQVIGSWSSSAARTPFLGSDYLHDDNAGKGTKSVTYQPNLLGGQYNVYAQWNTFSARADNVPITINHKNGSETVLVDQTSSSGDWNLLGSYEFDQGKAGSVVILNDATSSFVIADAVRFTQTSGNPPPTPTDIIIDDGDLGFTSSGDFLVSTSFGGLNGDYLHDNNAGGGKWAKFEPTSALPSGSYTVAVHWKAHPNRATNATVRVYHQDGISVNGFGAFDDVLVDMTQGDSLVGEFHEVGIYNMGPGDYVGIRNDGANGYVIVDAVRFTKQ